MNNAKYCLSRICIIKFEIVRLTSALYTFVLTIRNKRKRDDPMYIDQGKWTQAQLKENDSSWWRHSRCNGTKYIDENHWFGNANRINAVNFNATTQKLAEKFDHPFSHLFIFRNLYAQGHGFDVVTVAI